MIHNKVYSIGAFFWHTISLKKKSDLYHRSPSHEVEAPYRWSNSVILRIPWSSYGLVLGHWQATSRTEEQMLLDALQGRQMTDDEFSDAEKAHIRRTMIKKQFTAEQQELLVDALDI